MQSNQIIPSDPIFLELKTLAKQFNELKKDLSFGRKATRIIATMKKMVEAPEAQNMPQKGEAFLLISFKYCQLYSYLKKWSDLQVLANYIHACASSSTDPALLLYKSQANKFLADAEAGLAPNNLPESKEEKKAFPAEQKNITPLINTIVSNIQNNYLPALSTSELAKCADEIVEIQKILKDENYTEVLKRCELLRKEFPQTIGITHLSQSHVYAHLCLGNYHGALHFIGEFEALTTKTDISHLFLKCVAYHGLENYEAALEAYKTALYWENKQPLDTVTQYAGKFLIFKELFLTLTLDLAEETEPDFPSEFFVSKDTVMNELNRLSDDLPRAIALLDSAINAEANNPAIDSFQVSSEYFFMRSIIKKQQNNSDAQLDLETAIYLARNQFTLYSNPERLTLASKLFAYHLTKVIHFYNSDELENIAAQLKQLLTYIPNQSPEVSLEIQTQCQEIKLALNHHDRNASNKGLEEIVSLVDQYLSLSTLPQPSQPTMTLSENKKAKKKEKKRKARKRNGNNKKEIAQANGEEKAEEKLEEKTVVRAEENSDEIATVRAEEKAEKIATVRAEEKAEKIATARVEEKPEEIAAFKKSKLIAMSVARQLDSEPPEESKLGYEKHLLPLKIKTLASALRKEVAIHDESIKRAMEKLINDLAQIPEKVEPIGYYYYPDKKELNYSAMLNALARNNKVAFFAREWIRHKDNFEYSIITDASPETIHKMFTSDNHFTVEKNAEGSLEVYKGTQPILIVHLNQSTDLLFDRAINGVFANHAHFFDQDGRRYVPLMSTLIAEINASLDIVNKKSLSAAPELKMTNEICAYEKDILVFLRALYIKSDNEQVTSSAFDQSIPDGIRILARDVVKQAKTLNRFLTFEVFNYYDSDKVFHLFTQLGITQVLFPGLIEKIKQDELQKIISEHGEIDAIYSRFIFITYQEKFVDLVNKQYPTERLFAAGLQDLMNSISEENPLYAQWMLEHPKKILAYPMLDIPSLSLLFIHRMLDAGLLINNNIVISPTPAPYVSLSHFSMWKAPVAPQNVYSGEVKSSILTTGLR